MSEDHPPGHWVCWCGECGQPMVGGAMPCPACGCRAETQAHPWYESWILDGPLVIGDEQEEV